MEENQPKAKFNIRARVIVKTPFKTWTGTVTRKRWTGDKYEYWVTNSPRLFRGVPMLAWEHEMELAQT